VKIVRSLAPAVLLVVLAGCSSATESTATRTTSASASTTSSTTSEEPTSGEPTSTSNSTDASTSDESSTSETSAELDPIAAQLVSELLPAYASVTSLHGTLSIDAPEAAGGSQEAEFDETLADGLVTGLDMSMELQDVSIGIRYAEERLFVSGTLTQQLGVTTEWAELTEDSSNAQVSQLYEQFMGSVNQTGPEQYVNFLKLATNTEETASEDLNGVPTNKYTLDLDLTRLDSMDIDQATRESLGQAASLGLETIPCTFWINEDGLMEQVEQQLDVQGVSVTTTIQFTDYNEPLEIGAPAEADVTVV
jgi:hypothetical protein